MGVAGRPLINTFRRTPIELVRAAYGSRTNLRRFIPGANQRSYDVVLDGRSGLFIPKAMGDPSTYRGPNGASMRPNTRMTQFIVQRMSGPEVVVHVVPEATPLPTSLILVYEGSDHYSLQGTSKLSLENLNSEITRFLAYAARSMTKAEWQMAYPRATVQMDDLGPLGAGKPCSGAEAPPRPKPSPSATGRKS